MYRLDFRLHCHHLYIGWNLPNSHSCLFMGLPVASQYNKMDVLLCSSENSINTEWEQKSTNLLRCIGNTANSLSLKTQLFDISWLVSHEYLLQFRKC